MADVNANIGVHIDTSAALAELKALQRQLANFHSSVAKNSAAAAQAQKGLQTNLLNSINATGKFHAQMGLVRSSTESFTHALETNKLSMREYFRYAGGSTRTFGKLFKQEFNTIGKVAEERVKKMQTQYIKMGRDASGAIRSMSITPRTLDMNDYATKTALAAQKQALLNQLLKQGSTNLLNFGKNTQWAGRQLMVGFTIPLAYFGTAAAKTFMDLEKQAIRFKRVYGDMFTTTDETNKALADVQKLAEEFTKYGVAVVDTMEMAANAAAMGKTGADLTAQVAEATRLAVLGGVEQAQALETTISVTNAFGVAAEDLAKKINFLNAVENQTVVSIEDLTIAIPKAGPVVKQLGGDVEDLAFFLTAMKEGGINASEGANALKSGLASLINPTEKASKMLAGFGININAIVEGNQGNIRQTVIDFSRALDTLDPLNRARAIEQLFGKFQFSRLSTLFQNVTKDGTQAARVLDLAAASVEELAILSERELGVLEDAIGTDFKESVEQLKLAIAPIGKEFLKAITPVAKTIGDFLEKFNNLGDGTKKFIVVASTLVGVIGPVLLMTFGLLANGVANIIKLFITMRSGFLRAGANSNLLAQQTQYLNTEQLEAATVAASLNQAHTKLTQSFTAETTAVRLLRQAYIDATIAAANFARANPAMMMPGTKGGKGPKKFARGTTGLPGPKGAGDIIPVLGAPGEAIIPAEISQDDRFKPLIAALVSGDIKGYKKGSTGLGDDYSHVGGMKNLNIDDILKDPRISSLEKQKLETYKQVLLSQKKPLTIPSYGGLAYSFDPELNKAMAKRGVSIDSFEKAWTSRGPEKWMSSNITPDDARVIDRAILNQIKSSGTTTVTDGMVEQAFKNLPPEIKSTPAYSKMDSLHSQLGSYGIGRGLGSNPKTSEAILAEAKKKGYIKDYKIETRTTSKGVQATKSIVITNLDGTESNLGRGSKTNRQYISDTQDTRRKSGIVSGQTSMAKSPGVGVVGGAASDVRQVAVGKNETILNKKTTTALKSGKPVFVPGLGRFRMINSLIAGADDGVPKGQTTLPPGKAVSEIEKQFRSEQKSLRRQIEKVEKERIRALKEETKTTQEKTRVVQQTVPLTKEQLKEQKREVRAQRAQRVGRVAGPVASIAGIGAMAGFMTGNNNLGMGMMGVAALASIAPMLTNPLGLFVAGLVSITALIYKFNKDMEKARQEGVGLAKAMSMSSDRIKNLSMLSGKPGASEIQARKRQNVLNPLGEEQRKFGQNVLQGEEGKQILNDVEKLIKQNFSTDQIGKMLGTNLSQAVLQGVITPQEAKSIASALGEELGSYAIPVNITAKINELLGPNGEKLGKEPLKIALEIKKESMKNLNAQFDLTKTRRKQELTAGGVGAGALGLGAMASGAFAAKGLAAAGGLAATGVGAPIAAGVTVAIGVGLMTKAVLDYNKAKSENAKLDAAALQLGIESISQNQQLLDSINEYYDKKIKIAKTEKEINDLQAARKTDIDKLNVENAKTLTEVISLSSQLNDESFNKIMKTSLDQKFKDVSAGTKLLVGIAQEDLLKVKDKNIKRTLSLGFASEDGLSPQAIIDLVSFVGSSEKANKVIDLFIKQNGFAQLETLQGLFGKFGEDIRPETKEYIINYINNNGPALKEDLAALSALANFKKQYGISVDINTNGVEDLFKATKALRLIKDQPEKLTRQNVLDLAVNDPDNFGQFAKDFDVLSQGNPTISKYLYANYIIASNDPEIIKAAAAAGMSVPEYIAKGFSVDIFKEFGGRESREENKQRNTTFDDILQNLKRTRDATIDAQGGSKELIRILGGAKDLKAFNGIDQQLSKLGANSDFIDFVGGIENAVKEGIIKVSKKGVVSLTELGKAAKKAYDEKQLGLFSAKNAQVINESIKQRDAFVKLKAAGVETADAQEMLADATFMVSLAAQKNSKEIKKLINDYKNMKLEIKKTQEITDPVQAFKDQTKQELEYYDFLEKKAKASVKLEIDRINKLIDANDRLIEAKERVIEEEINRPIDKLNQDLSTINKAADEINKEYDEQEKALEKISSLNQEIAQQEKGRLSLADALSRGDISAAASAAQQMRADAAQNAMGRGSGFLQAARESELKALTAGGLTRAQIEEKIYDLEQKRLPLVAEIVKLQDDNYKLQTVTLRAQEDSLKKTLEGIDAARFAYEQQIIEIEGAQFAALGFNNILLSGEAILKRMKALWDSINSQSQTKIVTATALNSSSPTYYSDVAKTLVGTPGYTGMTVGQIEAERRRESGNIFGRDKKMYGGKILPMNMGGIVPKYFGNGGNSMGSDTVPAMLTPGEFVMNKKASQEFGPLLSMLNESKYPSMIGSSYADQGSGIGAVTSVNDNSRSVYNYNVGINVPQSNANPNDIARAVIGQIKYIDNQRIRGQR